MKRKNLKKTIIALGVIAAIQIGAVAHADVKSTYKEVIICEEMYTDNTKYSPTAKQLEMYVRSQQSENGKLNTSYDYIIDSNLDVVELKENHGDDKLFIYILSDNNKNIMDDILEIITPIIKENISEADTYCIRKRMERDYAKKVYPRLMSVLSDEKYWIEFLEQFKVGTKGQIIKAANDEVAGIIVSDKTFESNEVQLVSYNNRPTIRNEIMSLKKI